MQASEWQLKKDMCEIGHRIWLRGFCAGNEGNHSVRVSDNRFLCTPTGLSKGFLSPDDICVVDALGNQIEDNAKGRKRTSEVLVHLAIYKQRPDINAVIHSHPPHAVAFCIAGMPVPEGVHPEAEVFLGKIVHADYACPGTQDLPDSFLGKMDENTNTVLMGNHGSVNFAEDLTVAHYRLEILDNYCKQLLLARQLGHVNVLNQAQMLELLKVKQNFGFEDSRLQCVDSGCVGSENQAFLTSFDAQPATASCCCDGGPTAGHDTEQAEFETLVQSITDQILASRNG